MIEIMDNFLQLSWRHLPGRIPDRKPRNQISYHRGHLINIFYPVVYKKGLASPGLLPKKSLCNELRGKTVNFCINRLPVGWRCVDDAQVSGTHEGELKCSRSEEHTSELQSRGHLVCRLLLE